MVLLNLLEFLVRCQNTSAVILGQHGFGCTFTEGEVAWESSPHHLLCPYSAVNDLFPSASQHPPTRTHPLWTWWSRSRDPGKVEGFVFFFFSLDYLSSKVLLGIPSWLSSKEFGIVTAVAWVWSWSWNFHMPQAWPGKKKKVQLNSPIKCYLSFCQIQIK